MLKLTSKNYYSQEANQAYWSASFIKSMMDCPCLLYTSIASLTITVFVLSVRFSGFRDFVIDIIHRQSVIFQNLSTVL